MCCLMGGLSEECRWGVVSYADSLDCVGVLTRTVADTKTVFGEPCH